MGITMREQRITLQQKMDDQEVAGLRVIEAVCQLNLPVDCQLTLPVDSCQVLDCGPAPGKVYIVTMYSIATAFGWT